MDIIQILIGMFLMLLGRKLFWFFVGAVGFITGLRLAALFFPGQPDGVAMIIGLCAGILGALLALFVQRLAVGTAGFFAGGYGVIGLLNVLNTGTDGLLWLLFVIGGLMGALLVILLFDWALIVLSSLTGAVMITEGVQFDPPFSLLLTVVLLAAGITAQAGLMQRENSTPGSGGRPGSR